MAVELVTIVCSQCGISWGVPLEYQEERLEDHQIFYCPNGHAQHYPSRSTEMERLRRQLASYQRRYNASERSRSALKGRITRLRNKLREPQDGS